MTTGLPFSVSHLTALDAPPEAFCLFAADAGFDAVGLRINPPPHTPTQWPVAGDRSRTRDLRQLIDDRGLTVLECEGFSIRPNTEVVAMLPGLEASAALGSRFVLSAGMDPDESRMVDRYAQLCEAAAPLGLTVAMEFISWNPMRTLDDALRVHAKVAAPNSGILIDMLHLARTGGRAADVARVPATRIAYVQLCDAKASLAPGDDLANEARTRRYYPGDGELPLDDLLAAIPASTPMTLEAPAANHAELPPAERIRIAARMTRDYLATHTRRRSGEPRATTA